MRSKRIVVAAAALSALACGGIGPPAADTERRSVAAVAVAGDPLVAQCQQALACGCPNNPGETVESCVARWQELVAWGTQVQTISCFAALDCRSMCDISAGPGARCRLMMEQDALTMRARLEQRNHELNMEIIGGMDQPSTAVYDENGVKLYEY